MTCLTRHRQGPKMSKQAGAHEQVRRGRGREGGQGVGKGRYRGEKEGGDRAKGPEGGGGRVGGSKQPKAV